jgi:AcrR family transcriptional regulator
MAATDRLPVVQRPPRSRLPRAEREQQILDTAHDLFSRHGFAAVKMEDVANAVGVTKPLLYAYFGNKEQLYMACLGRTGDALVAAVGEAYAAAPDPGAALRAGLRAFFRFVADERGSWQVLYDETLPSGGPIAAHVATYREQLVALTTEALLGLADRRGRDARTRADALANALTASGEALARWWLRTEAMTPEATADLLIHTLAPGLSHFPGPPTKPTQRRAAH